MAKVRIGNKVHTFESTDLGAFKRIVATLEKANPRNPVHVFEVVTER